MGGKCKHEPKNTNELQADAKVAKVFRKFHLLDFFKQIKGHNTQLTLEFAQGFISDSVALRGHKIPITPNTIHDFIGLPNIREDLNKREQYSTLLI